MPAGARARELDGKDAADGEDAQGFGTMTFTAAAMESESEAWAASIVLSKADTTSASSSPIFADSNRISRHRAGEKAA